MITQLLFGGSGIVLFLLGLWSFLVHPPLLRKLIAINVMGAGVFHVRLQFQRAVIGGYRLVVLPLPREGIAEVVVAFGAVDAFEAPLRSGEIALAISRGSLGHALVVECLELGMDKVLGRYLEICQPSHP